MTDPDDIACRQLVELVTDYLERRLTLEDRRRFQAHLETCPGCETYLGQIRDTILALGRLSAADLASPAREELLRAFRGWNRVAV